MQGSRLIDELAARVNEFLASNPTRDFERNARALFSASLARLDLVTREEFDVQAKLLARAQERLATLEARVAELERERTRSA